MAGYLGGLQAILFYCTHPQCATSRFLREFTMSHSFLPTSRGCATSALGPHAQHRPGERPGAQSSGGRPGPRSGGDPQREVRRPPGPGAVAVAALYHDASEILTGDMPTPIKYDNPDIQTAYKAVEAVAEQKLLSMPAPTCAPPIDRGPSPSGPPCAGPGKGGGQALRLPQVPGGAEGGEHRVPQGQGADLRRAPSEPLPACAALWRSSSPALSSLWTS